jgi:hypothetical protein
MYFLKLAAVVFPALFGWATLGFAYAGPNAPPEFDITSFEATPDDDTDDTAAIQACITAAEAETPAIIHVPRGVYTIDAPLLITADEITLRGEGTIQTKAGNTTMTSMIDVSGDDFACELLTIDAAGRGVAAGLGGHCLRVQGHSNRIRAVHCKDPTDTCFQVHEGSYATVVEDCKAEGGLLSARVAGDRCTINRMYCKDFTGEKAITVDPQIGDAQYCAVTYCTFETDQAGWECAVLFDTADGGMVNNPNNTQIIECGTASNVNGFAQYTIQAGHGFKPGDVFRIGDSTISKWDRQHKIIKATGDLYARRLSATTFALYGTAAQARNTDSTSGRIDLVDDGTQSIDFYCSTPRAGRMTIDEEAIDYTNDILTTTESAPGMETCEPVRVTPHNRTHILPGGIQEGGTVLLNSAYVSAGSADTGYFRPKRLMQAICVGNQLAMPNVMKNDANAFKFNNVGNVLLVGNFDSKPLNTTVETANGAGTADDEYYEYQSVRFGANVRSATVQNCQLSGGIIINTLSSVGDLLVENCDIGDGYALQPYGVVHFYAIRSKFKNCRFRCTTSAIEYEMPDDDLESLEFDACTLEGFHATTPVQWLQSQTNGAATFNGLQLFEAGKIFFRKNNKATNWDWGGTRVTFVNTTGDAATVNDTATFRVMDDPTTAMNHGLTTGDAVYLTGGTLPAGLAAATMPVYVRVTGNNTVYFYTTKEAACSSSMTNEIDFQDDGSGTIIATSPIGKMGINPTGSGVSNLLMRCGASPFDLEDVSSANAVSSGLQMKLGMRIWNTNGNVGGTTTSTLTPGWVVTAQGLRGSTGSTVGAMGTLTP